MIKMIVGCIILVDVIALGMAIMDLLDEGKVSKGRIAFLVLAAVASVFVNIYGLDLYMPVLQVTEDQKSVVFAEADEDTTIMYAARTDDASEYDFVAYDGTPIPIEHEPTLVSFRTTFWWMKSQIQDKAAHIDEYGRVWIDVKPEVVYNSIQVKYKVKEPSDGREGNTYEGYRVTKDDLEVRGIKPNDDEVTVKDFNFSLQKLTYGDNVIEVVESESGQSLSGGCEVYADYPSLVSLTASLNDSETEAFPLGTELSSDSFEVKGTYEGGKKEVLDSFEITPIVLDEEGNQTITISKNGLRANVSVNVVDPGNISELEDEDNDDVKQANKILVNANYSGNLSDDEDVDFFVFTTKVKGSARISFRHRKMSEDNPFWSIALLSGSDVLIEKEFYGGDVEDETPLMRINPGTYYVRIGNHYESDEDYTFAVVFNEEDEFFESEPNDETGEAIGIETNSDFAYTGNLATEGDVDFYTFSLPQKGKVQIEFSHDKQASDNKYWQISASGDSRGEIASFSSYGDETLSLSDAFRVERGQYYVRVSSYYWNDIDYHLAVYYWPESDEAESESNDDIPVASVLPLNSYVVGNIQHDGDEDYYRLEYPGGDSLRLSFAHEMIDDSDVFWRVSLTGQESGLIEDSEGNDTFSIRGNDPEEVSNTWSGLAAGTYYIRIWCYYYNNSDYGIYAYA